MNETIENDNTGNNGFVGDTENKQVAADEEITTEREALDSIVELASKLRADGYIPQQADLSEVLKRIKELRTITLTAGAISAIGVVK